MTISRERRAKGQKQNITPFHPPLDEGEKRGGYLSKGGFALCFTLFALCFMLFFCSYTSAEGPSMLLNVNYNNIKQYEDGERINSSDNLLQNYYFSLNKSITHLLSYQLFLRTNLTNSHNVDSEGHKTSNYQRAVEPAIDLFFRNPIYGLNAGYRRLEKWSTAQLKNEGRETTDFYYTRFDMMPRELPSLSLQFDRQKNYDHLSPRKIDSTNDRYSGSTWYDFLYKGLNLSYNVTFTRNKNRTPSDKMIEKTLNNSLNGIYNIGYNKVFGDGVFSISTAYQGNYVRNKVEQFVKQTGNVQFERSPSSGLYALGTQLERKIDTLISNMTLSDNIFTTPADAALGNINLGSNGRKFHNLGIQLFSSEKAVDTILIYVNKDITLDTNLTNISNWKAYKSDFNLPGTWTEIKIDSITIKEYDRLNNVYYYEIKFLMPHNSLYFAVINLENASENDVLVTEIEAYGTDFVPQTGKLTDISKFFTQGINLNINIRPLKKLIFNVNYFLNRADENPDSFTDSVKGVFENIYKRPEVDKDKELKSNITRTYGAGATWYTHRFLTTTARFQRNQAFDNKDEMDFKSDSYSLDFTSTPLPTLDAKLSLTRSYGYTFDEKESKNDLYLMTIGTKLFKDVNMITDFGYTKSKRYPLDNQQLTEEIATVEKETSTTTKYIRGTIDARLTSKLYANITYGLSRTSGDESYTFNDGFLTLTYRPGNFINLTGNLKISEVDGDLNTTEGFFIDWLFLPAIRLNLSYEHQELDQESKKFDTLGGYVMWYITKFIDFQFLYRYTREVTETRIETYNFSGNLTCRFW